MSIKVVSMSLDAEIYDEVKDKVARKKLSKILRNYILNEYNPPEEYKSGSKIKNLKVKPISLNEESLQKIDSIVKSCGKGCNRSLVMRDILKQLLAALNSDSRKRFETSEKIVHSSYYFYEGTRMKLDQIMNPWERSSKVEYFLKTAYRPELFLGDVHKIKNAEEIKIDLDVVAHSKLVEIAKDKKVSNSEVMRDVMRQLLDEKILKDIKEFKTVLAEYGRTLGEDRVRVIVEDFYNNGR